MHLETQPFICNLILTVMQINPRLPLQLESLEGCVLDSCNWSSQWISADNDGDWTCFHCSPALCYMGMRTAGNLPFVDLLYFVLSHQCWCPRVHNTHTHTLTHTLYIIYKRVPPLQSLQSVHKANGRSWLIRRGARVLLQRERKHIGRTFNLPQLRAAKLNTRWKWRHEV